MRLNSFRRPARRTRQAKRRRQSPDFRRTQLQQLERRLALTGQDLVTLLESDIGHVSGMVQPGNVTVSGQGNVLLEIDSPTLTFDNSGTVQITAGSASLFPGQSDFTSTVTNFSGSYDAASGSLSLMADSADIKVGNILELTADQPSFSLSGAGILTFNDSSATATSPDFAGASATISVLAITNSGISFSEADLKADSLKLGGILQVDQFDLDVKGFSYTTTAGLSVTSATIGAGSVSLFPDQSAFTATVTNLNGSYDFSTGQLELKADAVDIAVSDALTIDATDLTFQLDPFSITVGSASASSPRFHGVGGSVSGLSITSDGFSFDDATLGATGTIDLGNVFTFSNLQFTLTNFGYSFSHGATFGVYDSTTDTFQDSTFGVSADSAALNIGPKFTASATTIGGSVDLSPGKLGNFTFMAGTVTITVGTYLELDATDIQFNPSATTGDIADFGSIGATLNVGNLSIGGSAKKFGIDSSGQFVAQSGFGVSFTVDAASSGTVSDEVKWPSWLPIQISQLSLAWPDFTTDPLDFTIDLSASVSIDKLGGSDVKLSGFVDHAIIDTGLLAQNEFPLIGLAGVGIEAGGDLFGAQVHGQFFMSMLRYDASDNVIPDDDTTTPVAKSYLYGGIDAGMDIAGEAGFEVRLGVSQLGPLQGYVSVGAPVIVDPIFTGLALTDFSAGIQFNSTLPDITDARQMADQPSFVPSSKLTLNDWKSLLKSAVENQVTVVSNGGSFWDELKQPMTLEGGVTIFSAYASGDTFQLKGDFKFDTIGHFFAQGDLNLGGTFDLPVDLYFNASDLAQGKGQIFVLARGPQQAPLFTLYGGLNFDFGNLIDSIKKDVSGAGALGPQLGTALQLNGADQYATAPNIDLNQQSFTAEFWAQRQDSDRAETVLAENNGIQIGFDANNDLTLTYGGSTVLSFVKPDNLWHDYAVSFDDTSGAVVLYVDGAQVKQGTISPSSLATADTTLYMGSQPGGGDDFDGSLDEVRVWNGVRTSSDIINNMDGPIVDPTSLKQLFGYWQFEDGAGTTATDSSPGGNTAQLVGNPQWTEANANRVTPVTIGSFTVSVAGGLELTAPSVGGVYVAGTATFTVVPSMAAVNMDVTGSLGIDPLGSLLNVSGSTHLEFDTQTGADGKQTIVPEFWGAFELQPGDLSSLAQIGLNVTGTALLRFNTDTTSHSVSLPDVATPVDLPATSLQFYVDGSADFQQGGSDWFHVDGTIIASFVVTGSTTTTVTDSNGNPIDDLNGQPLQVTYEDFTLDTLLDGTLLVGPTSSPYATFTIDGFMQIADSGPDAGIAAEIDATLADSGSLATNGVDLNASFFLELNTTGEEIKYTIPSGFPVPKAIPSGTVDIPAAPTDVNGNAGAAGPYLLIYGNGDVTLEQTFDLSGSFDLQVSAAGVMADFDSKLTVPGLGSLNANGALTVDSAGLTGYLSMGTPDVTPGNGFSLSGDFILEVNTTNGLVTVGPANDSLGAGQVLIKASGDLNAGGLDLNGVFDLSLNSNTLDVYAAGHVEVGSLGKLDFTSNLTISSDGVYGDMALHAQSLSGALFTISGTTDVQINTTDSPQGPLAADTVMVHIAGSAQLQATLYDVTVNSFLVQGTFDLTEQPNYVHVAATGSVSLAVLGTVSVSGDLSATSAGIWGDLEIGATALPNTYGFSVSGEMQLEINTTSGPHAILARPIDPATGALGAPQNVTLAPYTVEVAIGGNVSLLNSFTLAGELDVSMAAGALSANLDANVALLGLTLTVSGSLGVRGNGSVYGRLDATAGGNSDLSFAEVGFTISASATFTFDTANQTASFQLHGPEAPYHYQQYFNQEFYPAEVGFFGMTASGYLTVNYSSGVTKINVPDITVSVPNFIERGGASLWNHFFGNNGPFDPNATFTLDASGFFQSDGQFELTVGGTTDIGSQPFETGLGATAGYLVTIGNFTGEVPTGYNLTYSGDWRGNDTYTPTVNYTYGHFSGFSAQAWALVWLQDVGYALFTGGTTIASGYFNLNFWAAAHVGNLWTAHEDWGWLPGIDWNLNIGGLSGSLPAPAPVIDAFSPSGAFAPNGAPIDSVNQGTAVTPYVQAHVPGGTITLPNLQNLVVLPVSYSEKVYYHGNLISTGPSFTAAAPGTYEVDVTATDAYPGGLSTTQRGYLVVNDVPPTDASFNMVSSAIDGQTVTTSSVFYNNPAGNSEYDSWTVTQHGTLMATGTGTNFTFRPEIAGTYTVTAVISDDYGGSTRVSRTLTVINVGAGLAFYNNGPVNEGSPVSIGFSGADPTLGLTYSFDFQNDGNFSDPGDVLNSSSPTASYTFTTPGVYTIHGRASAPGGAHVDYYTTVTISDPAVIVQGDNIQGTEGSTTAAVNVATFTDPGGALDASHYQATIDWGDGATGPGWIVANGDGSFSVVGSHRYAASGSYPLSVAVEHDQAPTVIAPSSATIADAPLAIAGETVLGVEGQSPSGGLLTVATFTDPAPQAASQYSVELNWNDGTAATPAIVVQNGNTYSIEAIHTFAEEGDYPVTVMIIHSGQIYMGQAEFDIADAPLVASGQNATAVEGGIGPILSAGNVYNDNNGQSDIVITTVNTSGLMTGQTVTISGLSNSAANGDWSISVLNGTQFSLNDSSGIDPGAYTGGGSWAASGLTVATFTDTGGTELSTDYSATIQWGDGTSSAGNIVFDRVSEGLDVQGNHVYAEEGTYTVTTVIGHDSAQPVTTTSQVTVVDAPLAATPVTLNAVAGQPLSSTVASHLVVGSFIDTDPAGAVGDYTATIDWGDGSPASPGVVAYDSVNNDFVVWAGADHIYTASGTYQINVTIDDAGGASVVADSTAVIQQAELEPDPLAPGQNMLVIGGTTGNDQIVLAAGTTSGSEAVTLNGVALGTFAPTSRTLIFGQAGSDQYQVDAPLAAPLFIDANTGTNSLYIDGAQDPAAAPVYDTIGAGTNVLTVVGDGADDSFTLTKNVVTVASPLAANQPIPITLTNIQATTIHGGSGSDDFIIADSNVTATLLGDTGNDLFAFQDGASLTGRIVGGTGGGTNTLDWSQYTTARNIALTAIGTPGYNGTEASSAGGFKNINAVVGSSAGGNTLAGPNLANSWTVSGLNSGSLNGRFAFAAIQNLIGQSVSDVFAFTGAADLTGAVTGGSGNETLDYSGYGSPVAVTISQHGTLHGVQGSTAGVTQSFDNIDALIGNDGATLGSGASPLEFIGNFDTSLTLSGFAATQLHVAGDFSGSLTTLGTGLVQLQIDGTLTPTGLVNVAGDLTSLVVGGDLAGEINVGGKLNQVTVAGGTPGDIFAGSIGTIEVDRGYGPDVLQVDEAGIQRRVEATTPGNPNPLLQTPPQTPTDSPNGVTFQFIYEGEATGLANPQLTIRADNTVSTVPDQYDLSLVTDNDAAKFNLARLDAVGVSGIRNVAVEGDLLTSVTSVANSFFNVAPTLRGGDLSVASGDGLSLPSQSAGSTVPGGIQLPLDALAGVAIRDYAPDGDIEANSIQAVAFGSHSERDGRLFTGAASHGADAAELLAPGTAIVPANDIFRVPFADLPTEQVAFFFNSDPHGGHFDEQSLVLTVQNIVEWNGATGPAMANVTTPSNAARGAVTALIQIVQPLDSHGHAQPSQVQNVAFIGDGASLTTSQPITGSITSTGPLGDLSLKEGNDALNIITPSIFGSVDLGGPLSGVIETTGIRIDPITGAASSIPADIGRLYVTQTRSGPALTDTTFHIEGGLSGQLLVLGNVDSNVVVNGPLTGQAIVLGTITDPGSLTIHGGIKDGGLLAVQGNVSGPLEIDGGIDASSALIAGGNLGSTAAPFQLNGDVQGILAAVGRLTANRPLNTRNAAFYGASLATSSNALAIGNASAIQSAFSELDSDGPGLIGQNLLVGLKNGQLSFSTAPISHPDNDGDNDSAGEGLSDNGTQGFDQFFDGLSAPSGLDELSLWTSGIGSFGVR